MTYQIPSRKLGGRILHQSTISFADQTKTTYSTTHTESFSKWDCDGQPLLFLLKEPYCPFQHYGSVDLSNIPTNSSYTSTHSRDVHSPKDVLPQSVLRSLRTRNWIRNCDGLAMKEITHPPEATHYGSYYQTEHCRPANKTLPTEASGQPTYWNQHNILTGEERGPVGPGKPRRQPRERELCAARRWENDCNSLRLH